MLKRRWFDRDEPGRDIAMIAICLRTTRRKRLEILRQVAPHRADYRADYTACSLGRLYGARYSRVSQWLGASFPTKVSAMGSRAKERPIQIE